MCAVGGSFEGTDDGTGDEVDTFVAVGGCLPAVIEVKVHQANDICSASETDSQCQ